MTTLLLTLAVFSFAVLLLCLGTLVGGRRIHGSCGGLNRLMGIESDCGGTCGGNREGAVCPRKERVKPSTAAPKSENVRI